MSRNGAGTYSLPAGNPVVTGTTIQSTWANTTLTDIATAMTASIANDGQTPILANLPMFNFKFTSLGAGNALTDSTNLSQLQNSTVQYLTATAGTDTITATATPTPTAYAAGQVFRFISAGANTTTSVTLNISALGAKNITKNGATALAIGDIPASAVVEVMYDGTQFQLIGTAVNTAVRATSATSATTSTNLASGALGSIPYQSAASTTAFVAGTTSTTPGILTSIGTGAAAQAPALKTLTEIQSLTSGQVLQELSFADSGGSTSSTTLANLTVSTKSITPKSTNSNIKVIFECNAYISNVGGVNTQSTFQLYETNLAGAISFPTVLFGISNGTGGNAMNSRITVSAIVGNAALTTRTFGIAGLVNNASATTTISNIYITLRELQV